MASTDQSGAGTQSVEQRYQWSYDVLRDRARLTGALKAMLVARFGHYAFAFAVFFVCIVAPETLGRLSVVDIDAWVGEQPVVAAAGLAVFVAVDYLGFVLARGMRYPLARQLHQGTGAVDDWRAYLGQSFGRLPTMLLLDLLVVVSVVVGLGLLIVPGVFAALAARPVRHCVIDRGMGLRRGIAEGIRMTRRHVGALAWRGGSRSLRRFGLLVAVAALYGVVFAIETTYFGTTYAPRVLIGAAVLAGLYFLVARPFAVYLYVMQDVAFHSALAQSDGEVELADL